MVRMYCTSMFLENISVQRHVVHKLWTILWQNVVPYHPSLQHNIYPQVQKVPPKSPKHLVHTPPHAKDSLDQGNNVLLEDRRYS